MRIADQQTFEFRTWGGRRVGAGPTRLRTRPSVPHRRREELRPYQPAHVTFRVADWVWNLRSQRAFAVIHGALRDLRKRAGVRVNEFSIQGNHLHLIVEANGSPALTSAMRALSIRLARRLNVMMGRRGPVFEDRYHMHVLRTPAEVRNAIRYVVGNYAGHASRWGEEVSPSWVDPYSSRAAREPWLGERALWPEPVTREAETWLQRTATPRARYDDSPSRSSAEGA